MEIQDSKLIIEIGLFILIIAIVLLSSLVVWHRFLGVDGLWDKVEELEEKLEVRSGHVEVLMKRSHDLRRINSQLEKQIEELKS